MNAKISCARWKRLIAIGIALNILGTLAIIASILATYITVILFGILLIVSGISYIIDSIWVDKEIEEKEKNKHVILHAVLGILNIAAGIIILFNPLIGALSLTLVLAIFFIFSGVFRISNAFKLDKSDKYLLLFSGVVSIILGIFLLFNWQQMSYFAIGLIIGIDMIFTGWSYIFMSINIKNKFCEDKNKEKSQDSKEPKDSAD